LTTRPSYEQAYEALFEQTNDAAVILDLEGNNVAANHRATEMLGYPLDELIGLPMTQMVSPDEHDDSLRRKAALLAGESVPIYERGWIRKDGVEIRVEVNECLVRDKDGRPAYFQVVGRDVSERNRVRHALRQISRGTAGGNDETFFHGAVQHLARALDVRCALVTERKDPESPRVRALAWWCDENRTDPLEYDVTGTPCEQVFEGNLVFHARDIRQNYPNDEWLAEFKAESYLGIPLRSASDQVIGHLAVVDDRPMSDDLRHRTVLQIFASWTGSELARRRSDRERDDSEMRYRSLVEQLPAITYTAALDARVTLYVSPQVETVLGFTVDEFCGVDSLWPQQLHPDDREAALKKLAQSMKDGTPFLAEYRIYRKDGSLAWVRDAAVIVHDSDGTPRFLQGIVLDVTHEKRLTENLLNSRRLESVGMLAGGIAHDFNNSLMGVLGNLSIAKSRVPEEHGAYDRLLEAENAAQRIRILTQQLLTFSKGGAPVRRTTSIDGLIRDSVQFVLSGSNVDSRVEVDPGLRPADVDAGQIRQVIEHLVLNAVQAMPDGGTVRVAARNTTPSEISGLPVRTGEFVRIEVSDEGVGIPPDAIDRIFDPFFTTKEDGRGLGLATSYAIVQKHDGHIGVRPRQGGGTEFTVYLPVGAPNELRLEESAPAAAKQGCRFLVMDDDDLVRDAIGVMLRDLGHAAEFVPDGDSAIQAYRAAMRRGDPFDAVLLDLTIRGGYGGEEAMRRLTEIDPHAVGIVSSGYSDSPVMAESHRYGFKDCIAKPFRREDLRSVLDRVLR